MTITATARELFRYREMARNLVRRDLVERYQRSTFGVVLSLLMPVIVTTVFSLVFSGLMPGRDGVHYAFRVFIAYIAWDYCSRSITIASETMRGHSGLIGKVYFPLEVLPLTVCLSVFVHLVVGTSLFVLASGFFGAGFHWTMLWLPLLLALSFVFTLGLAMVVAVLGVLLQDFQHLLTIAMLIWFYGSAIFYSPSIIPSPLVRTVLEWNPMYQLVEALRACSIDGRLPDVAGMSYFAACTFAAVLIGQAVFRRSRYVMTEVLG